MLPLLPLVLVSSLVTAEQLPANMLGKYQLETSEGFSDFMSEIGVNWFTRQVTLYLISPQCIVTKKTDCLCALPDSYEQEPGRGHRGHRHLLHLQVDLH